MNGWFRCTFLCGTWPIFQGVNNSLFVSGVSGFNLYLPLLATVKLGADLMNRCWGAMVGCRESQGSDLGLAGEFFLVFWGSEISHKLWPKKGL